MGMDALDTVFKTRYLNYFGNDAEYLRDGKQEIEPEKGTYLLIRGQVKMASHLTIGQILAKYHAGYKKVLLEIYFEIILNDYEPDISPAKEMFQVFDSLFYVRFANTVFVRRGI